MNTSVSSRLRVENSETTAPSSPASNQWSVSGGIVHCSPGRRTISSSPATCSRTRPWRHRNVSSLPGSVPDRGMAVLGAHLVREEDKLFRAHALRVHVDDDLQSRLLQTAEAEVGHLDRLALGGGEDDPRVGEHRRRTLACLSIRHSETGAPLVADSCRASSVRACPSASSRPSSNSPSPRIASLRFSSSSR